MMSYAYLAPSWFFGYDVALELIFAIISIVISFLAFRIYKKTDQKQVQLFGIAFLFIAVSYVLQSLMNFLMISEMNKEICRVIKLQSIALFNAIGLYSHIIFMLVGLMLLVYMTFRTDNTKVFWTLLITSLLAIYYSFSTLHSFHLISSVFLVLLSWHFINNYLRNKQTKTLLVALAFLFLLFGSVHFIFSVDHQLFYALGHVLELFAYLMILTNYYLVIRK